MNKIMGNKKIIVLFTLPTILLFTVVVIYPIIQTVLKSFCNWDGLNPAEFTGLKNYIKLFDDKLFYPELFTEQQQQLLKSA